MNQKDLRIKKLHDKGMTISQIARKVGYGNPPVPAGIDRVKEAFEKFGIEITPNN